MQDGNRDLLLGELKEFKSQTLYELKGIKRDIHKLNSFRLKMVGMAGLMAFLATLIAGMIK